MTVQQIATFVILILILAFAVWAYNLSRANEKAQAENKDNKK